MAEDDPFERAAERTRRSVIGREEGPASRILDLLGKGLVHEAVRIGTIPKRFIEAGMIADPEERRETLAKMGGELTGTAALTMFGPKGGGGVSAKVVGGIAPSKVETANALADLLPKGWKITQSSSTDFINNFLMHAADDKFIGVVSQNPVTKKWLMTSVDSKVGDTTPHWGETVKEALSKMQEHRQKLAAAAAEKENAGVEAVFAKLKSLKEESEAAKPGTIPTLPPAKIGGEEWLPPLAEAEMIKIRGKTYYKGKDNKFVSPEEYVEQLQNQSTEFKKKLGPPETGGLVPEEEFTKQSNELRRAKVAGSDLPPMLPPEELEAARQAGGYTTQAYRGRQHFTEGRRIPGAMDEPIFSSANPDLAGLYAGVEPGKSKYKYPWAPEGSQIQPLMLDTRDYLVYDAKGRGWVDAQHYAFPKAREQGKKGVVMHNVYDEPSGGESTSVLRAPQTVYATFDPRTRKSQFARQFDPQSLDMLKSQLVGKRVPVAEINKPLPEEEQARNRLRGEQGKRNYLMELIDRVLGGANAASQ